MARDFPILDVWTQHIKATPPGVNPEGENVFRNYGMLDVYHHGTDFARMIGLHGVRVDDPAGVGAAWDEALAAGRPSVLEAVVDPETPPLPPHITFEQAKHFAQAALADQDRGQMVRQSFRQMVDALLTRR